jgi:hypothetical protein
MHNGDLPSLEGVATELTIFDTAVARFDYPKLGHVGGTVKSEANAMAGWTGLANRARVDGDFLVAGNAPVTDATILDWVTSSELSVAGKTAVCSNGGSGTNPCPNN